MNVYISGGGKAEDTKKFDAFFVANLKKGKPLLYIPIAKKDCPYSECYAWIQQALSGHGWRDIEMWTTVSGKKLRDLKEYAGIYIGGGNTYSLLNEMRQEKFLPLLKEYIAQDGIVYGGSAGAIILGKTIRSSTDKNSVGITDLHGINVLHDLTIVCHYHAKADTRIATLDKPLLALSEGVCAHITEKKLSIIGGSAKIFSPQKKNLPRDTSLHF